MWNFKSHFLVLLNSFILSLIAVVVYAFFIRQIELGEKIGKGIFYIRGYYTVEEETQGQIQQMIVDETGIGLITIPLLISLVITFGFIFISRKRKGAENQEPSRT